MIANQLGRRLKESPARRTGTTLVELCLVLVVMVTLAAIALPKLRGAGDRAAVRAAIQETSALFSLARRAAITRRAMVAVAIDTAGGVVYVRCGPVPLANRGLRAQYGVRLTGTRDSMSYDPRGFGYGAANLTVVAQRGQSAETLFVSRLGRMRH